MEVITMALYTFEQAVKYQDAKVDECWSWYLDLCGSDCIRPHDIAFVLKELQDRTKLRERYQYLNDRLSKKHLQ